MAQQAGQRTIHLLQLEYNRTYDVAEVSLITMGTLAGLSVLVGHPMQHLRFRPNFVIETLPHLGAYPENNWVGRMLALGAEADATSDAEPLGEKRRAGDGGASLSPISTTKLQIVYNLGFCFIDFFSFFLNHRTLDALSSGLLIEELVQQIVAAGPTGV